MSCDNMYFDKKWAKLFKERMRQEQFHMALDWKFIIILYHYDCENVLSMNVWGKRDIAIDRCIYHSVSKASI